MFTDEFKEMVASSSLQKAESNLKTIMGKSRQGKSLNNTLKMGRHMISVT
jgi:hypothetical protein